MTNLNLQHKKQVKHDSPSGAILSAAAILEVQSTLSSTIQRPNGFQQAEKGAQPPPSVF